MESQLLSSIKQTPTPLNTMFFCKFNVNVLQRGIRQNIKNKFGKAIDYQNEDDLLALMRAVFVYNSATPYKNVNDQVRSMNAKVIDQASEQIATNLTQYYGYIRDISSPITPMAIPQNTSAYGNKIGMNDKIGI